MVQAPHKPAKALSKAQVLSNLADITQLSKKQIEAVFAGLSSQIRSSLGEQGPGLFVIPGLVKIEKKTIPAKPARKGVRMPSGELRDLPAKPASIRLRLRPLKGLKDLAEIA